MPISKNQVEKTIALSAKEAGLSDNLIKESLATNNITLLTSSLDVKNKLNSNINNLIRQVAFINLRDGDFEPFSNHRASGDNLLLTARSLAKIYQPSSSLVSGLQKLDDNKDSINYEQVVINAQEWDFQASTTKANIKNLTTLEGFVDYLNSEANELYDSVFYNLQILIWQKINSYEWSDEEKIYTGIYVGVVQDYSIGQANKNWIAIEKTLQTLIAKNGTRKFNQKRDGAPEEELNFLNKISKEKITIAIDSEALAEIKQARGSLFKDASKADDANPWNVGKIEVYNFKENSDLNIPEKVIAYIFFSETFKYTLRDEMGEDAFGYSYNQQITTKHLYGGMSILKSGAKVMVVQDNQPSPPPEKIVEEEEIIAKNQPSSSGKKLDKKENYKNQQEELKKLGIKTNLTFVGSKKITIVIDYLKNHQDLIEDVNNNLKTGKELTEKIEQLIKEEND